MKKPPPLLLTILLLQLSSIPSMSEIRNKNTDILEAANEKIGGATINYKPIAAIVYGNITTSINETDKFPGGSYKSNNFSTNSEELVFSFSSRLSSTPSLIITRTSDDYQMRQKITYNYNGNRNMIKVEFNFPRGYVKGVERCQLRSCG